MKFTELNLKTEIQKRISEKGFDLPTEIQIRTIPLLLEGKDVLGESQTGTGKTLSYAASILSKIESNGKTQALVLVPTRELALQIEREFTDLAKYLSLHILAVYGGIGLKAQVDALKDGIEIVVGTPGRVLDLEKRNILNLKNITTFVLDEADEMLQMGFIDSIETLLKKLPEEKQFLMFSATVPERLKPLIQKYMKKDHEKISVIPTMKTSQNIEQNYYIVEDSGRIEALCRIIEQFRPRKTIVFCRTKRNADFVLEQLHKRKYSAELIHGDIAQQDRILTLDRFKEGSSSLLIATDVAARGIHVDEVDLIINFNLPESKEAYIHRIGRTGRAHHYGRSATLVTKREERAIRDLEKYTQAVIHLCKLPSLDDILNDRVTKVIEKVELMKNLPEEENLFSDYVRLLTGKELEKLCSRLLDQKLREEMDFNFSGVAKPKMKEGSKREKKADYDDGVRIFLTIGKKDKIQKKELLDLLEKEAGIKSGSCYHVEVLDKFTFMNVKKDAYSKVIDCSDHWSFRGRKIHIENAKK